MPSLPPPHVAGVSISNKKAPLVLLVLVVVLALFGRGTTKPPVAPPAPALAPPAPPVSVTPKAKLKATSGPVAYFCNSGYVVKYHATADCPGLENCSSSVDKIALSTAQSRMEPCQVCH